jgi:hypothetical protein
MYKSYCFKYIESQRVPFPKTTTTPGNSFLEIPHHPVLLLLILLLLLLRLLQYEQGEPRLFPYAQGGF